MPEPSPAGAGGNYASLVIGSSSLGGSDTSDKTIDDIPTAFAHEFRSRSGDGEKSKFMKVSSTLTALKIWESMLSKILLKK